MLYLDHQDQVAKTYDDIVLDPIAILPKVLSPKKVTYVEKKEEKLPSFYRNLKSSETDQVSEGEPDSEDEGDSDLDSDYELESDDDDLFVDNVVEEYIDQGKGKGKKIGTEDQVIVYDEDHDYDSIDDELELPESSHGKGLNLKFKTFKEEDMDNPIFKVGMLFPSVEMLRKAIT